MIAAAILRLALDVRTSSYLGAALVGEPALGQCLSVIAWRESKHEFVSVHDDDAWMARSLGAGWSTRGVHGQVAAYAWPHVPAWLRWLGPVVLDIPLVSAVSAARRHRSWRCRQTPACASWRRCAVSAPPEKEGLETPLERQLGVSNARSSVHPLAAPLAQR